MEGFAFETELVDHMSGPAGRESAMLDELARSAMKAGDAVTKLGESHAHAAHISNEEKGFLKEFTGSLVPEIALGELAAEGVKKIGEGVIELAKGMAEIAIEGERYALEMSEFKENATAAYSVVLGSAEEGERAFAAIDELGRGIHMPVQKAHDLAAQLMEQGLENTREVEGVIQAVSDLQRTGNERGASKLERLVEKSLASGTFEPKGKALAGTGIQLPQILSELATQLHQPIAQVKEELKAGKINAETGIAALENVFARSKVHEIAAEKFTLTDLTTDVHNSIVRMFEDFDPGPLLSAFRDMGSLLDLDTGSGHVLNATLHVGLTGLLDVTRDLIEETTVFGLTLEKWALKGFIAIFPLVRAYAKLVELGQEAREALGIKGESYGTETLHGLHEFGKLLSDAKDFQPGGSKFVGPVAEPVHDAHKAGEQIANGIVGGVKEGLEIHSPSAVMAELGRYAAEGFAVGVEDGTGDEGHAKHTTVDSGAIQVTVHAPQAHATAEEIREVTTAALEDALEQLLLELGG